MRPKTRFFIITTLVFLNAAIWTESFLSFQNTIQRNSFWDANRIISTIGKDLNYYAARSIFAQNHINLNSMWHFLHLQSKERINPTSLSFDYRSPLDNYFEFLFNQTKDGYEGLRFSFYRDILHVQYFKSIPSGKFTVSKYFFKQKFQINGKVHIQNGPDFLVLNINDESVKLPNVTMKEGIISFVGQRKNAYIDNLEILDSKKGLIKDDFSNYINWEENFLINFGILLFLTLIIYLFKQKILQKSLIFLLAFNIAWSVFDHYYYSLQITSWDAKRNITLHQSEGNLLPFEIAVANFFKYYSKLMGFEQLDHIKLDELYNFHLYDIKTPLCYIKTGCLNTQTTLDSTHKKTKTFTVFSHGGSLTTGQGLDSYEKSYNFIALESLLPTLTNYEDLLLYDVSSLGATDPQSLKKLINAEKMITPDMVVFASFSKITPEHLETISNHMAHLLSQGIKVVYIKYFYYSTITKGLPFVKIDTFIENKLKGYKNFYAFDPYKINFRKINNTKGRVWLDSGHLTTYGHEVLGRCLGLDLIKFLDPIKTYLKDDECLLLPPRQNPE